MGVIDKYYLFITVFFSGAAVLMLEILGTRIISPFFGTTLYVWSSLISVTIIFLALGYYFGGKIADSRPEWKILYLFIFISALLILITTKIDVLVLLATGGAGAQFGPLIASAILFGPTMFLLGAVTPFAVKLQAGDLKNIGVTAGNLYAVSTVGSFFGGVATGFFLIPVMGVEMIATLFAFFLFAVSGIWFIKKGSFRSKALLVLFLVLILVPRFGVALPPAMEIVYKTESAYSQLKVVDIQTYQGTIRILMSYGSTQTAVDKSSGESLIPYTHKMIAAVLMNPSVEKVLLIGTGGGIVATEFAEKGIETDTVELDPEVLDIAKKYFWFRESEKLHAFIDDGRHFLSNSSKKYGLILMDVYSAYTPPAHMFTLEMFTLAENSLSENGIFVINTVGWPAGEKAVLQHSIYKTLREVFPYVYVSYDNPERVDNVMFFASERELDSASEIVLRDLTPMENAVVITDDFNPVEQFSTQIIEEWRNANIETLGSEILLG